jgi:hypothetical protein
MAMNTGDVYTLPAVCAEFSTPAILAEASILLGQFIAGRESLEGIMPFLYNKEGVLALSTQKDPRLIQRDTFFIYKGSDKFLCLYFLVADRKTLKFVSMMLKVVKNGSNSSILLLPNGKRRM